MNVSSIPEGGLSGYFSPAGGPTQPVVVPLGTPLGGLPLGSHLAPLTESTCIDIFILA